MKDHTDRLMNEYFHGEVSRVKVPPVPDNLKPKWSFSDSSGIRQTLLSAAASITIAVLSGLFLYGYDQVTPLEKTLMEIEYEYQLSEKTITGIQKLQQLYSVRYGGQK